MTAFEGTAAAQHPEWFFEGDEFTWVDTAYPCTIRTIPVHKEPASLEPNNVKFDRYVSHLCVHSEHCMGALKGRFQSLHGLQIIINNNEDHDYALRWVTCTIILHNLVIDFKGLESAAHFVCVHTSQEEMDDSGQNDAPLLNAERRAGEMGEERQ